MRRKIEFVIDPSHDGQKLFSFLRGKARVSLGLIRSLKRLPDGMLCNGGSIRTVDIIHSGDVITLNLPEELQKSEKSFVKLDILYQDDDLLIIDKPPFLAMHESHNHQGDALSNAVAGYLQTSGKPGSFHAVGRLDKDTSGLVVCALNRFSAAALSGRIEKKYMALVQGEYEGSGTIDLKIYRPDPMKTLRACGENGEIAITHWTALQQKDGLSLLDIHLETGRTHQIRVHFASMGTPLAGDEMYGGSREQINRQALHCYYLCFTHPVSGEKCEFSVPLPEDMKKLI